MFSWEEFADLAGPVTMVSMTCASDATLLVPDAGHKLIVYKAIVDGIDGEVPRIWLSNG